MPQLRKWIRRKLRRRRSIKMVNSFPEGLPELVQQRAHRLTLAPFPSSAFASPDPFHSRSRRAHSCQSVLHEAAAGAAPADLHLHVRRAHRAHRPAVLRPGSGGHEAGGHRRRCVSRKAPVQGCFLNSLRQYLVTDHVS